MEVNAPTFENIHIAFAEIDLATTEYLQKILEPLDYLLDEQDRQLKPHKSHATPLQEFTKLLRKIILIVKKFDLEGKKLLS